MTGIQGISSDGSYASFLTAAASSAAASSAPASSAPASSAPVFEDRKAPKALTWLDVEPPEEAGSAQKAAGKRLRGAHDELQIVKQSEVTNSQGMLFKVMGDIDRIVVQIVDTDMRKVLRQIPSQDMVGLFRRMMGVRDLGVAVDAVA